MLTTILDSFFNFPLNLTMGLYFQFGPWITFDLNIYINKKNEANEFLHTKIK